MSIRKTLCAIVLATTPAFASQIDSGFPDINNMGGFEDASGRVNPPPTTREPTWRVCGKDYRKQFDQYYTNNNQKHKITRKEKKQLEDVLIPYAMMHTLSVQNIDLDNDGKKDFVSTRSESRVNRCAISKEPFTKDSWVYIEFGNGKKFYTEWSGPAIKGYTILLGTPIIKFNLFDELGFASTKNINWSVGLYE